MKTRVLVVDDERAVRSALSVNLTKHAMQVTTASDPASALEFLHDAHFDLVLTDVRMPGGTGLELAEKIRSAWPDTPVIVMTGHGSVRDAVTAMKFGAADYIIKPIAKDELLVVIERALERRALQAEVATLRREVEDRYGFEKIVGSTPVMQALYTKVAAVADTTATVLLQGPTGTGKELLAHALHYRSSRASGPFVRVNCAAIPKSLLESELFGHEKGSFTGAIRQHRGKFEQADGGTLLLDEIGEIDPYVQVKLLRVLENGELSRVGSQSSIRVDVRIVAATNKDLRSEAREGRFRTDLFYRLNVVLLTVPSLAQRAPDIPLLVDHFLRRYAEKNSVPLRRVSRAALERLLDYPWPGNVRQLEHVIERAVILSSEDTIRDFDLPHEPEAAGDAPPGSAKSTLATLPSALPPMGTSLQQALAEHERAVIIAALKEAEGVQARAARRLGLSRSNLSYRIRKLGVRVREIDYG
jgi:DNA-binding NtrC family response regulator